jgi:hypothetical protein
LVVDPRHPERQPVVMITDADGKRRRMRIDEVTRGQAGRTPALPGAPSATSGIPPSAGSTPYTNNGSSLATNNSYYNAQPLTSVAVPEAKTYNNGSWTTMPQQQPFQQQQQQLAALAVRPPSTNPMAATSLPSPLQPQQIDSATRPLPFTSLAAPSSGQSIVFRSNQPNGAGAAAANYYSKAPTGVPVQRASAPSAVPAPFSTHQRATSGFSMYQDPARTQRLPIAPPAISGGPNRVVSPTGRHSYPNARIPYPAAYAPTRGVAAPNGRSNYQYIAPPQPLISITMMCSRCRTTLAVPSNTPRGQVIQCPTCSLQWRY